MIKEKCAWWQRFSAYLGQRMLRFPISANTYTWITVLLGILGYVFIAHSYSITGLIFFILAGLFDIVDGAVARAGEKSSHYGAFLDGSLDRFVDFFVIFSYFKLAIITPYWSLGSWVAVAVFCALMPSFEVAYANHRKAVDDPSETKIWRILNRGEMYPLMLLVILVSIFQPIWAGYVLAVWVSLAAITTLQTLYLALHLAKKAQ
ncbi:MAG: CDP-alcohol phosphatidyltransferase family protein [Gammaproteobacteria bacterium]|jgi:phosphatidylglycerophosphate synthase|nr:CDP-alcohol phosphatidyltransferase family protein [Gammaproteobacteria bacterium]